MASKGQRRRRKARRQRQRANAINAARISGSTRKVTLRKGGRKGTVSSRRGVSIGNADIHHLLESLEDPFMHNACIPDGALGVACFTVHQELDIQCGASGTAGLVALNTSPTAQYYLDSGSSASTFTVSGNWGQAAQLTNIAAQYARQRCVSFGLKVMYTGATQTDQGLLTVAQMPSVSLVSALNGGNSASIANSAMFYKTYPLRQGAFISWRPSDIDDMLLWVSTNTSAEAVTSAGAVPFPWLVVGLTGGANSTSVHIEFVANYEGQIQQQTFVGGSNAMVRSVPPALGWYEKTVTAIDKVQSISSFIGRVGMGYASGGFKGAALSALYGIGTNALEFTNRGANTSRSNVTIEEID